MLRKRFVGSLLLAGMLMGSSVYAEEISEEYVESTEIEDIEAESTESELVSVNVDFLDLGEINFNIIEDPESGLSVVRLKDPIFDLTDFKSKAEDILGYGLDGCTYTITDVKGLTSTDYTVNEEEIGDFSAVDEYKMVDYFDEQGINVLSLYFSRNSTQAESNIYNEMSLTYFYDVDLKSILSLFMSEEMADYLIDGGNLAGYAICNTNVDDSLVRIDARSSNNDVYFNIKYANNYINYADEADLDFSGYKYNDWLGENSSEVISSMINDVYGEDMAVIKKGNLSKDITSGVPIGTINRDFTVSKITDSDDTVKYMWTYSPHIERESAVFDLSYIIDDASGNALEFSLYFKDSELFKDAEKAAEVANMVANRFFNTSFDEEKKLESSEVLGKPIEVNGYYDNYHLYIRSTN